MKWYRGALAALVVIGMLGGGAALAADKSPNYQVYQLGEVVVSDQSSQARRLGITSVFTAEEIEQTHAMTVPEALQYMPGVSVTMGRKNEPAIRIHGFDQHESLILIDGIPYYETNYGKLNLSQLATGMISRIDVIKGAPSVLYGPNAMAGVINIITKKQLPRPTFSASAEFGNYGNYNLSASHGNSLGKFNYWFHVNRRDIDGWRMSSDYKARDGELTVKPGPTSATVLEDGGKRDNSDFTQTSIWAKAGVELGPKSKYYLSAFLIDSEFGFPPSTESERVFTFRPAFSTLARMEKYQDWGLDFNMEQAITKAFTVRGKLFYHSHMDDYASYDDLTYSNKIAVSRFEDYLMGMALFADYVFCPEFTLRGAFHYRGDSHKERADDYLPLAESFSYTGSVATEAEWKPFKGFAVVAGISYDWFSINKAQANMTDKDTGDLIATEDLDKPGAKRSFNPMIGITYTLADNTRFFASVARKTRFPTLQQLFSGRSGNIELDPEYSINYTVGVSRPFGKIASARFSVFYHGVSDRISRDGPDPDDLYRNYADIKLYGFEIGGGLTPIKGLSLHLDYTYLKSSDDSPDSPTDNVIGAPEHKVDMRISYTVPKLGTRIHLQGLYMAEQYDQLPTAASPDQETLKTGSYFLANIKVAQPLWDYLELFAYVNNVFDRDYESEVGYPGMGRNFWVGLRVTY